MLDQLSILSITIICCKIKVQFTLYNVCMSVYKFDVQFDEGVQGITMPIGLVMTNLMTWTQFQCDLLQPEFGRRQYCRTLVSDRKRAILSLSDRKRAILSLSDHNRAILLLSARKRAILLLSDRKRAILQLSDRKRAILLCSDQNRAILQFSVSVLGLWLY